MKNIIKYFSVFLLITFLGCKRHPNAIELEHIIPNGNFEQWDNLGDPLLWKTNNCTLCVPQLNTYLVQKDSTAQQGNYAAKFVFNGLQRSIAINKFYFPLHVNFLRGYIKSNIAAGDTATIKIEFKLGNTIASTNSIIETTSSTIYKKIEIPITTQNTNVDTAIVSVIGGKKAGTHFVLDNLSLIELVLPE